MTFGGIPPHQPTGAGEGGDPGPGWDAFPPSSPGYPPHPGYAAQPRYPAQPGYPAEAGYATQPGHTAIGFPAQVWYPPGYFYVAPPGYPYGAGPPGASPHRVRRSVRGLGALLIVAGALGAIGSIGPWAWVRGGAARRFESFDETISGLGGGGALTLALSAAITIVGILLMRQTLLGLSITALCCGGLALLVGVANVATINAAATQVRLEYGINAGTSWGLWLMIAASAAGAVAGLVALIRGRWIDPREQPGAAPGSHPGSDAIGRRHV